MKKICHCLKMPHDSYVGGVATIVNSYFNNKKYFENMGYKQFLFDYQNEKINYIRFTLLQTLVYGFFQKINLIKFIKSKKIDVLHIHTSRNSLFIKDILLGSYIHAMLGTKIVVTIHVGDISTVFYKIPSIFHKSIIKKMNRNFDKVCFLSNGIRRQFIDIGMNPDITTILYNYSDIHVNLSNKFLDSKVIKLLFVGMINKDKGIFELLDAFKMIENKESLSLRICGNITDNAITDLFNNKLKNISSVELMGYISGKEKAKIYSDSDILILPSYHEGFPLVILEALRAGCAIITTPVGAIPEVLTSENCIYVQPGSADDIKEAIKMLITNKDVLYNMKKNNQMLSKKYSARKHIEKLCNIYDEILQK